MKLRPRVRIEDRQPQGGSRAALLVTYDTHKGLSQSRHSSESASHDDRDDLASNDGPLHIT